jgi:hypothetical protein
MLWPQNDQLLGNDCDEAVASGLISRWGGAHMSALCRWPILDFTGKAKSGRAELRPDIPLPPVPQVLAELFE